MADTEQIEWNLDKPIPPELIAEFPAYLREYVEAGRKLYAAKDDEHRKRHGHGLLTSPRCLLSFIAMKFDDGNDPARSGEDRLASIACCRLAIGSLYGMILGMVTIPVPASLARVLQGAKPA